jgi:acyl-CoA thioesterase FadM
MATSENVLVLMDEKTRKSTPLYEETIDALKALNVINITL